MIILSLFLSLLKLAEFDVQDFMSDLPIYLES